MKNKKFLLVLVGIFFIIFNIFWYAVPSYSQTWDERSAENDANREILADQQEAQREMGTKIYGRVTGIDADRNVISLTPTKWVDDGTAMGDNDRYFLESNVNFTGRSSLDEISVGDYITINYYIFGGLNRATDIIFEKQGERSKNSSEVKHDVSKVLVD
ncbi:MAG: hypothetical protein V3S04_04880 [Candidatus Omnitrophota bacterium]